MDVWMPVQKLVVRLNRCDHAGHHILESEQPPGFRLEARPGTGRKFTQQLAIEARMHSQTLGDGQDDLPMRDGRADFLGDVQRCQQRPLLVAGGTSAALLAGEGDEHLVLAVGTTNSGEAFLQIAALEKSSHRLFDDGPPETILGLIALVVDLLEGVKVLVEQTPLRPNVSRPPRSRDIPGGIGGKRLHETTESMITLGVSDRDSPALVEYSPALVE